MIHPAAAENPLLTRADLQRLLLDLVAPLPRHFTPGRTGIALGHPQPLYGEPVASLEGYARPLWGLVPLALGGGRCTHWSDWRAGLIHGTDPTHPEFWGWPADRDQRDVELPAIALATALLPHELWTPLSAAEKDRAIAWFSRINAVQVVDNNWRFFRVLANLALRRLGRAWSRERLDADLRRLDEFYLGRGWYNDGIERRGDYYVPMAFHFYSLLFATLAEPEESAWIEKFRQRARAFAPAFQHWFAADGEALPFGRSLTYRFAQGAFWGALAYAGEEALPWGVIKGLYLRHLRWWMRQPIFTETGVLSVGYRYPNWFIGENYNGAGSPYWALKTFLPLALPDVHPFWQAVELPAASGGDTISVPEAGMIVSSSPVRNLVVALNAGQPVVHYPRHAAAKYSKCAYATGFAFSVPTGDTGTLAAGGNDSVIALSDDGIRFHARATCVETRVENNVAYSVWRPWPDVEVRTWLIPAGTLHVRVHRVQTQRPLWSSDGGFAVGLRSPAELDSTGNDAGEMTLRSATGSSAVCDLIGTRSVEKILLEPNAHLSFPLAAMPTLRGNHGPGTFWLAGAFGAAVEPTSALSTGLSTFTAEERGDVLIIFQASCPIFRYPTLP